jgi:hypothetical protein
LRSKVAKQWELDDAGQILIERIISYDLATNCAARFERVLQPVWDRTQLEFHRDPVKYPAIIVR